EEFLKHFGLESIKELPSLEEFLEEFEEEKL
ncbi:SMC-Scp complex subunit ScpB, partial [Coprococcus sp. MSK.21.13]|nr:SMC-Scp complex subunit ScpB [Coprococcus sp. MSK.21.13]